jgi:c-di-GMP-binding flagellar brake protein YcgR
MQDDSGTDVRPRGRVAVKEMAKDLHLRVGDRVLITPKGSKDKVRAELVGLYSNEFLIVFIPPAPGTRGKFEEGVGIQVRYLHSGKIIGFESSVLKFINKPRPLLFLEFPLMLEKMDLRSEERYECSIPCIVQTKFERIEATIIDISRGGCRFTCDGSENKQCVMADRFELDEMVVMMFAIENNEGMTLSGKIKNRSKENQAISFGLSYTKLSSDMYEKLDAYIERKLAGKKAE